MRSFDRLRDVLLSGDLRASGKWFLLAATIGVVAGLGAVLFQAASQAVLHYTLARVAGYAPREPAGEHSLFEHPPHELSPWLIVGVMAAGGFVSGLIVFRFAPEAEGHGTDAAIEAFHQKRGLIRARVPLVKLVSSAITIGTGGCGGREGPIAQIGAGFGSFLATQLKLSARDRRIMLAAGMGAGVGAIFRAPLAGALFAAEILYKEADLEADVIVPSAIASIVAYSVFSSFLPAEYRFMPLFGDRLHYALASPIELLPLVLLAVVLVLGAILHIKAFYGTQALFHKVPIPRALRSMLGAGLAGVCGIVLYWSLGRDDRALAVLGTGYGTLQIALEDTASLGIPLLWAIALVKIVTMSLTIGSGGSGGVFGPSMVIGGCLGAAVGQTLHKIAPALAPQPEIYAIVGMAGFFSAAAHAPISTIIMVSEMTGDYRLLVPTMWVSILSFLMCRRWTLYVQQVPTRLDSPAHRGDLLVDVLEGIRVGDVPLSERETVVESTTLREILHRLPTSQQNYFPVVDEAGRLVGIFSTDDVRSYFFDESLWQLANARDIMTTRLVTVTAEDDLNTAIRRFTELNLDEIPVVDAADSVKLRGMLRRKDAIALYNRRLLELKQATAEQA